MREKRKKIQKYLIIISTITLFVFLCGYYANKETQIVAETIEEEQQSFFETVALCGNANSFQRIRLYKNDDGVYNVYMPSEMRTDVYVQFEDISQLQIGDVIYQSGDSLTDIYKEGTYPIAARDEMGNILEEGEIKFYFSVFMPSVYIETVSGSMEAVDSDKSIKETVSIAIIDEQGNVDVSERGSVKARGNTSFQYEQKSYSVNLNSAQEILGMSEASEWALLANCGNSVHQLKNKIVLDIAQRIGMQHTPDSHYVNVYIDHQYNGMYLLTQKVSADGGSVKFYNSEGTQGNITGPYLMEVDARYAEEPVWFKTNTWNVVLKYPKAASEDSRDYISNCLLEAEKAIWDSDGKHSETGKNYSEYLDIDSWVNMYLMQEFFVQWDVEFASFYLYKQPGDSLIYAGPVWDFDLAYGNMYYGHYPKLTQKTMWLKDNREGWLGKLASYPEFDTLVRKNYEDIFSPVFSKYLEEELENILNEAASSVYMNAKRWNRGEPDIYTDSEQLVEWIKRRQQFLDEYWKSPEQFQKVTFAFEWGPMSHYVKIGEKLGFLPYEEFGENAYDRGSENGEIIGWKDEQGTRITEDYFVKNDSILYPIYNH